MIQAPATLPRDGWKAKWIAARLPAGARQLPIFRKRISLDRPVARAAAYFCGLGQHELSINGKVIGDDVLDPGWTNYRKTVLYATHDVTAHLRSGENVLAMMLGNGMYNVTGGRYVKFKGSFGDPKLIFQMVVDFAEGSSTTIVSDETWEAAPGPITFSCIYGGEDYDARLADPAHWTPAVVTESPGGELRAQTHPPIRVMQTFAPVNITEPRPGIKVYDFGQNMSGRARVSLKQKPGATVTLVTGELLTDDGLTSQKNTGSPVSYSYTCAGSGVEQWNPRFTYTGFRYVQAQGAPLESIEAQFTHSSARVVGRFECSDDMLNRIHALINKAILSNMQSVLTDCPHREKLGWLEQTHLMGDAIMFNYDVSALYAKISRDMREAQHADGMVPTIAPQYTEFKKPHDVFNNSPEWGSAVVINPWLVYRRYGERSILEENYPAMKAYVEYLHSRDKDGIIEFGLGDWYDIGEGAPGFSKLTSLGLTGTAVYFQDVQVLVRVARLLGFNEDAARYAGLQERILNAFNARYFDPAKNLYDHGSQTALAMPLALGMVPDQHRHAVLENLVADIRLRNNHITAGDIGFHYVVRALGDGGRSDVMLDLLRRSDPPSYGSQLARGATTLTEAWDANPANSQNHFMLGHAELWFYEYLAGIQIDLTRPAPDQITIRPAIAGDLSFVRASYDSVLGTISSQWRREGDSLSLEVAIPAGGQARIFVPGAAGPCYVGPGDHHFESLWPG